MNQYLIIADDFTGANDTGVQLVRRGIPTNVVFRASGIKTDGNSYVLDTETRNLPPAEADCQIREQVSTVRLSDYQYVIKKVDSTLRGNIAQEVKAVDDAYQSELVIFMPALPDLGRTTCGGIHMLKGTRITETELSKDPVKPVREDRLRELLMEVYTENVTLVGTDQIRNHSMEFTSGRIFVCDAENNDDMKKVIQTVSALEKRTLWVGSAAIADHLLDLETVVPPSLALVASVSETTRNQVKYAANNGAQIVSLPIYELLQNIDLAPYVNQALAYLAGGQDVMIISSATWDRSELERTMETGKALGMKREHISALTQKLMGELTEMVLTKAKISGLFVAGGDTAIGFFDRVHADGSKIIGEVSIGIPMMRITGGSFDGLRVITKAGAFGNEDAISYGLRKLKEQ